MRLVSNYAFSLNPPLPLLFFSWAFASVADKQYVDTFPLGCLVDELFERKSPPHTTTLMVTFIHQLHFPQMGKEKKLNFDW